MQKTLKVFALLSIAFILSSCAIFNRKPEIVHVDDRVFIVGLATKDTNIGANVVTLVNPYFPSDKAIIISAEKFKEVVGSSIDTVTEREVLKKQVTREV